MCYLPENCPKKDGADVDPTRSIVVKSILADSKLPAVGVRTAQRRRIRAERLDPRRLSHQVRQRRLRARIAPVALEIEIEPILPGPVAHRVRLDLGQIDVPQGERTQRIVQRAGLVTHGKDQRRLARIAARRVLEASQRDRPGRQRHPRHRMGNLE